jgi:hypothetical protein
MSGSSSATTITVRPAATVATMTLPAGARLRSRGGAG